MGGIRLAVPTRSQAGARLLSWSSAGASSGPSVCLPAFNACKQVLVSCPEVSVVAAAVLLAEQVLPYIGLEASEAAAAEGRLRDLAQLMAAAGLHPGHRIQLQTNLVCFRRSSDGADAKLVRPLSRLAGPAAAAAGPGGAAAGPAAAAGVPAGAVVAGPAAQARFGGQAEAVGAVDSRRAFPPLAVHAGAVQAALSPAPAGTAWPAALGPNMPHGDGPDMEVVLHCEAAGC